MSVTANDIEKVAKLSRLLITEEQIPSVTDSINDVLGLIDKMQNVNTNNVEPLANPHDAVAVLRQDEVTAIDQREQLMQNAPASEDGLFLVPKVIE